MKDFEDLFDVHREEWVSTLYNVDTEEWIPVIMCVFDRVRRGNYYGREPVRRTEKEMRVKKFKNCMETGNDEATGEMIKIKGELMIDWV